MATRGLMMLRFAGMVALTFVGGCAWPGVTRPGSDYADTDPSVRWVYEAGGQLAMTFLVPNVVDNQIADLAPGGESVFVTERGPGCITWSPLRPRWALSLETGRLTLGWPAGEATWRYEASRPSEEDPNVYVRKLRGGWWLQASREDANAVYLTRSPSPGPPRVGLSSEIPHSWVMGGSAIWFEQEQILVFSTGHSHLVCVDTKMLRRHFPEKSPGTVEAIRGTEPPTEVLDCPPPQ